MDYVCKEKYIYSIYRQIQEMMHPLYIKCLDYVQTFKLVIRYNAPTYCVHACFYTKIHGCNCSQKWLPDH